MSATRVRGLAILLIVLRASAACAGKEAPTESPGGPLHPGSSYFASPSGSEQASGDASDPWDLATALSGGGGKVHPGDTLWLRGGNYPGSFTSSLSGTSSSPIIVRQYPGERATVDGNVYVEGSYAWYWGFEVANTRATTQDVMGIDSHCRGCRFIDLVIHDHSGNGLGMWAEGPDQEAYGNIVYNNGFHGQTADHSAHGIYGQNRTGTQIIRDNLIFDQFGYGVHVYGSDQAALNNYTIEGNTAFNNGVGLEYGMSGGMDYQVGGEVPLQHLVFTQNNSYRNPSMRGNYTARLGYNWGPLNYGGTITDNYFVGSVLLIRWGSVTNLRNSIFVGGVPTQTRVVVQPNQYETGRANVVIYNWAHLGSVSVDLSSVLRPGEQYEVRDAQDFYGPPIASGSYAGGSIDVPLAGTGPARSITGRPTAATGIEFAALVVLGK